MWSCADAWRRSQVEDARSTMAVFMHVREQYELDLLEGKECVAGLPR
jgi:hypothetical protein